ncbi:TIGR00266 family protein [Niveibacterium terrae]|uniref:TIGR00266 family protein n=1 Tax=Niveibacterium terrae TaxID=3373598 RepID=UPI003A8D042E
MKAEICGSDAFAYIDVELAPGEGITAEPDAMSSMSADLDLKARFNGGFFTGLMRKWLGGESLFISHFSNNTNGARRLTLVQPTPGSIRMRELANESFLLQPGAYLASTDGLKIGVGFAGFVSWIAGEGLFRIVVRGSGKLWYGAYGALLDREIDGEYIVDSSHLVAYPPGIKLKLQLAGGLFSSFFGGEGLVTRVVGRGRIVIQTRSVSGLTSWINPKLR